MTIRTRLALWYSGLLTVIIIILSLTVFAVNRIAVLSTIDNVLNQTITDVMKNLIVTPIGDFGELKTQVVFKSEELFRAPGISVQVWQTHDDGQPIEPILVRASNYMADMHSPLDAATLYSTTERATNATINGIPGRVATLPFYSAGVQQMGVIQVATSIQPLAHASDLLFLIVCVAALISIGISLMLNMWLAKHMLKPVQQISQAAASIVEAKDLSTRLEWDGADDELGQLSDSFNRMMERLEHLFKVQQRFVGDVSHEMRTPLTSILGNLEIMERYGVDQSSLEAVHREAARMSRMVNDLLLLVRADSGELNVDLFPVDVDTVLLEVYEQAHSLARGRNLKIVLATIQPARIQGNSDRLKQLLLNLVNNAIKFTTDGGTVTLACRIENQHVLIEVKDTGIGISEADMKRIFDRFYQADNSRMHHSDSDGAGLGLSIVRWIVDAHSGTIDVSSKLGEGTVFRVKLPLMAGQAHQHVDDDTGRHQRPPEIMTQNRQN